MCSVCCVVCWCSTFKRDIINHLGAAGGGTFGTTMIAPNDLAQYGNVMGRLKELEVNEAFQVSK